MAWNKQAARSRTSDRHGRRRVAPAPARDADEVLAFHDFPVEHWIHLRTTKPIESTFATVRACGPRSPGSWQGGRRPRHGLQAERVPPRPAGERSTAPTSYDWSVQARASKASWSSARSPRRA
ncbi:hypothetical protein DXZ75_09850 [Streptomyces sp. AcE210]|nr:hypothetical protein DXZ75_09850 [Streptomyces sp. AcE210]